MDKNPAFSPALHELQKQSIFPSKTKLRQVKYLNNSIENDHKSTQHKCRYQQWYQSFKTAKCTLDGIETIRMIQKGQIRQVSKEVCVPKIN